MINFILFWVLPFLGALAGVTLALVWRERRLTSSDSSFELVSATSSMDLRQPVRAEFLFKYFASLNNFIKEARESLIIVDYLAHHQSLTDSEEGISIFYRNYFRVIEEEVQRKGLSYVRIVQPPLPRLAQSRDKKISDSLSLMFSESFNHVERMLSSDLDFKLYILDSAFRPYSFVILDGRAILTEYDRYTKRGISVADHFIINRLSDIGSLSTSSRVMNLIELQEGWCNRLTDEEEPVTWQEFKDSTPEIKHRVLKPVFLELSLSNEQFDRISKNLTKEEIVNVRRHDSYEIKVNEQDSQEKLEIVSALSGKD